MMGSILLISDIHADIGSLDEILGLALDDDFSRCYGRIAKVINMGDVMERGHEPGKVIDRLEGLEDLESILGNHDEAFLASLPISGSDIDSEIAHEEYRKTGRYEKFFRGMGKYYVDTKNKLYVAHGGPIDPCAITPPDAMGLEAWLYSQPWQRISETGVRYLDSSGYHYLPADAFDAVRPTFGAPGFAIICGHEHGEAAYREKGGLIEYILPALKTVPQDIAGRHLYVKKLAIDNDANYLVRLGIAGPEGYGGFAGERCYFGVYSEQNGESALYLISFVPLRKEGTSRRLSSKYPEGVR